MAHQHEVQELALFGSVLRDDCRLESDVDCLVTFHPAGPVVDLPCAATSTGFRHRSGGTARRWPAAGAQAAVQARPADRQEVRRLRKQVGEPVGHLPPPPIE